MSVWIAFVNEWINNNNGENGVNNRGKVYLWETK